MSRKEKEEQKALCLSSSRETQEGRGGGEGESEILRNHVTLAGRERKNRREIYSKMHESNYQ